MLRPVSDIRNVRTRSGSNRFITRIKCMRSEAEQEKVEIKEWVTTTVSEFPGLSESEERIIEVRLNESVRSETNRTDLE